MQQRLSGGCIWRWERNHTKRADESAHVVQVAGAAVAVSEVGLEAGALALGQIPLEVVGHQLDELAADERVAITPAPGQKPHAPAPHERYQSRSNLGAGPVQQHALVAV